RILCRISGAARRRTRRHYRRINGSRADLRDGRNEAAAFTNRTSFTATTSEWTQKHKTNTAMRKLILIILPVFYLGACTEPAPPPPPPKKTVRVKSRSDNPEDFNAVEKPPSYGR